MITPSLFLNLNASFLPSFKINFNFNYNLKNLVGKIKIESVLFCKAKKTPPVISKKNLSYIHFWACICYYIFRPTGVERVVATCTLPTNTHAHTHKYNLWPRHQHTASSRRGGHGWVLSLWCVRVLFVFYLFATTTPADPSLAKTPKNWKR